jgi:hypothetical protein
MYTRAGTLFPLYCRCFSRYHNYRTSRDPTIKTYGSGLNIFIFLTSRFQLTDTILTAHFFLAALAKASLNVSMEGAGESLPDSSLNIRQEKPGISHGSISTPSISTEGDPINPSFLASTSLILRMFTVASTASIFNAFIMFFRKASSDEHASEM